jgi:hypothetical protein
VIELEVPTMMQERGIFQENDYYMLTKIISKCVGNFTSVYLMSSINNKLNKRGAFISEGRQVFPKLFGF